MKCPFCGKENFQVLPRRDVIRKNLERKEGQATVTEDEYYDVDRGLCLECGYVFECMSEETLKKYHEEKQYFTN